MRQKRSVEFYREKITELISECTHGTEFDHEEFENLVSGLQAAASVDGLKKAEFDSLVTEAMKGDQSYKWAS